MQEVLPPIKEKYGSQLELMYLDINEPINYRLMLFIEEDAKLPKEYRGVPMIVIGHDILVGTDIIKEHLEEVIEKYLAQGGVDFLVPPEVLSTPTPVPTATPSALTPVPTPAPPVIALAYFYAPGCHKCDRVYYDLKYLQSLYPNLKVSSFDLQGNIPLAEWLGERYGVPSDKRLTAPLIFIGEDYLVGDEVGIKNLEALIKKYASGGAEPVWENWQENEQVVDEILNRFRHFGPLTVALAGLIDGLNPCAFATIIFFISYLAFTGRKGRDILLVGAAFALGIFLTYLGIGIGFLRALQKIPGLREVGRWIYIITAVLCFVLAAGSFRDFLKARQGRPQEMGLRMPMRIRRLVNRVIRESTGMRLFIPAAFVIGFIISLLEFTCTGQVYLPTIIFVLGVPAMRIRALSYLLLYNVLFIVPLVVVFLLAFFGTTSEQLGRFLNRNVALIKVATAVLFLALGGWLLYVSLI